MDAYSADRSDLAYSDQPPVFVTASILQALEKAQRTVEGFGFRVAGRCRLDAARSRLEQQAAASAIWVELDQCEATGCR